MDFYVVSAILHMIGTNYIFYDFHNFPTSTLQGSYLYNEIFFSFFLSYFFISLSYPNYTHVT